MREPQCHSPWSYKLDSYNPTKGFLLDTETYLRDLHTETSEDGHIWENREEGKGKYRRVPQMQPRAYCGPKRLGSKDSVGLQHAYSAALRNTGIESTFLPEWPAQTVAKSTDRSRDGTQRYSTCALAAAFTSKNQSHRHVVASTHVPRVYSNCSSRHIRLQCTHSAALRIGWYRNISPWAAGTYCGKPNDKRRDTEM